MIVKNAEARRRKGNQNPVKQEESIKEHSQQYWVLASERTDWA